VGYKVEGTVGRHNLKIETGDWARQANGAAVVTYGDTVVLTTAVCAKPREGLDFFPLTVEYREMTYAAGKFPGGFFKREGRPSAKEILTMRLVDRPIRPLFPKEYQDEVQIVSIVLSADKENDPDILAMIGASAALSLSEMPFLGPTGSVRVGRWDGQYVILPTIAELEEKSDLDLVVSGTEDAVTMVEAGAKEVPEEDILGAIEFGHKAIKEIVRMIRDLAEQCGKPKIEVVQDDKPQKLFEIMQQQDNDLVRSLCEITGKKEREIAADEIRRKLVEKYSSEGEDGFTEAQAAAAFEMLDKAIVRELTLEGRRVDGRAPNEIRPVTCEVGVLPRTHGSAIFTRGETQALVVATLGTAEDEQRVDGLLDEYSKKFMLHYNFPPFSVGEVKPIRGPSRRDIGHGALAERCLESVLPSEEEFPYTIRIVSDILESNGSSSMATVCGASLCLMDAGVPIKAPVVGIAMGLIKEGDRYCILSDICGAEDHLGDMDFKIAATEKGITGLQMDIKTTGISAELMRNALEQAREAREVILQKMMATIDHPRPEVSKHAPRLSSIRIDPDKIGLIIGSGGKTVKKIEEDSGARIEIEDDGNILISGPDTDAVEKAKRSILGMTAEAKVGDVYAGRVVAIKDFGAFVEILPGQDGLLHISEISDGFVKNVGDILKVGDEVKVKVISIDDQGRVRLSKRALTKDSEGAREAENRRKRSP